MSTGTQTGVVLAILVAGWWYFQSVPVLRNNVGAVAENMDREWCTSVLFLCPSNSLVNDHGWKRLPREELSEFTVGALSHSATGLGRGECHRSHEEGKFSRFHEYFVCGAG